jgi:PilZ domain
VRNAYPWPLTCAKYMPHCPRCHQDSVRDAPFRWSHALAALVMKTYECQKCGTQFFGFRWARGIFDSRLEAEAQAAQNRRAWVRHVCERDATCRPSNQDSVCLYPSKVRDISRGGLKLIMNQQFEPGSLLNIQLECPDKRTTPPCLVEVIHCQEMPERRWAIGCKFTEILSEKALDEVLGKR